MLALLSLCWLCAVGWLMHECITAAAPQVGSDTAAAGEQAVTQGGGAQGGTDPQGVPSDAASTQQAGGTRKRAREDGAEDRTVAVGAKRVKGVKEMAADGAAAATPSIEVAAAVSSLQSTARTGAASSRTEAEATAVGSNREEEEDEEEDEEDDDDGLEWE